MHTKQRFCGYVGKQWTVDSGEWKVKNRDDAQLSTVNSQLKNGYKQTEVGVIPEEWEVCRLDSLGSGAIPAIKAGPFGSSLTKDIYVSRGYKVYGQEQVIRGDYLYGDYFISTAKYCELESCAVSPGDVLLSLVGTMGKILVIPEGAPEGVINPRLIRFSFDRKRVCPQYFKELFESAQMQSFLVRYAQGGTMGVLNASMLRPISIVLPPLPEQRAIATALSDVDALLAAQDKLIAKKRDIKQAAMQQLLTGKQRLRKTGENGEWIVDSAGNPVFFSGEWEMKRLRDVITHCFSGATPRRNRPEFYKGNVRWITSGELNYNIITDTIEKISFEAVAETNLTTHPAGTFLMAITGLEAEGTRGACGIIGAPATTNQSCMAVLPTKDLTTEYLFHYYVFRGKSLALQYCQGTKQQSYTAGLVKQLPIELPPTVEEQLAIATVLSDMDTELAALEQQRDKTRALKQGMMQELLTGRIRLI